MPEFSRNQAGPVLRENFGRTGAALACGIQGANSEGYGKGVFNPQLLNLLTGGGLRKHEDSKRLAGR
jgi:hypothetical protein